MNIDNKFYTAKVDENGKIGDIIAKLPVIFKKKQSGKEIPRYKVIIEYEDELKASFDKMLNKMNKMVGDMYEKQLIGK